MNLLIVDDIATNRKLLRVQLEAEGHTTLEAADGVEALQILARESVDAVISDILMPNMDGFRLCHEVRKSDRLRALPFVVYTSTYTSPNDMKLAETVGADKYIMKPAPTETLLQALREVTAQKAARLAPPVEESYVLKQYSEALVHKLEEKNAELQQSVEALQRAHDRIVELNANLESRVKERTAELGTANRELTHALSEVKELSGLLPICSYCKKIRDDKNYWQSVEGYISQHTKTRFSSGICPVCYDTHVKPLLDEMDQKKIGGGGRSKVMNKENNSHLRLPIANWGARLWSQTQPQQVRRGGRQPYPFDTGTQTRTAGFQTCCIADFQVGRASSFKHIFLCNAWRDWQPAIKQTGKSALPPRNRRSRANRQSPITNSMNLLIVDDLLTCSWQRALVAEARTAYPPLPAGEGRGEGERSEISNPSAYRRFQPRTAGFQTCCIADFQVGRASSFKHIFLCNAWRDWQPAIQQTGKSALPPRNRRSRANRKSKIVTAP